MVRAYQLPPGRIARRARRWWVYDQRGTRYLDFWQADGAAFLGHRPAGLSRVASAEIDRGLWEALPTPWPHRLRRALASLSVYARVEELVVINGVVASVDHAFPRWLPTAEDGGPLDVATGKYVVLPAPGLPSRWEARLKRFPRLRPLDLRARHSC